MKNEMGKRQDGKNRMFLKPSPNEEVKLLQDEKQKLRKLRLQQVREQEKALSNRVRKKFQQKEKKELNLLGHELKRKWEDKITEEKTALEILYLENVSHVGEGHQAALEREDDGEPKVISLEDQIKVAERYKQALKTLKAEETQRTQCQHEKNVAKRRAMEMERIRAARIAALEPPAPDIAESLEMIQKHKYKQKNVDSYSSTYYHVPQAVVERADPNDEQVDARYAAKEEGERIQNAKEDADRNFSEQMEKARLRHKHARSKLMLQNDHDKLIEELEYFERIDRRRRQDIVSKIPKHVFEPPHRRMEANEERQREIEHAFEDMYMAQTNYMGDVTVAREPFPASPAATDDALDISAENNVEDGIPKQLRGVESEKDVPDSLEPSKQASEAKMEHAKELYEPLDHEERIRPGHKPSSNDPLGRLMKKIDLQRWRSNKMKMMKDDKESHDTESTMSDDKVSEISEGPLTITTDNSSLIESAVLVSRPHETLLHPHEEAERTRAAISRTEGLQNSKVEKQKQLLQQQKLKLQLQQQQVLQEHLQLQFDMLQHENETKAENTETDKESFTSKPKDSPKTADEDSGDFMAEKKEMVPSRFDSCLSSGLLSEDGNAISESDSVYKEDINAARSQREDTRSSTSRTADSRVDASLGRHEPLYSIPESLGDDVFAPLTPITPAPVFGILPQPKPLHIEVPASLHSGSMIPADRGQPAKPVNEVERDSLYPFSRPSLFFRNQPPLYSNAEDSFSGVPLPRPELPQIPSIIIPPSQLATSIASTLPSQFPDMAVHTDTASYLKFYQEQLVEQQARISEEQRAIQQRQQQRLEQLKQFQERLRSQRIDSATRSDHDSSGLKHMTDTTAYWRSLIPTSLTSDAGSSTVQDTPSDTETREANDDISSQVPAQDLVEKKTTNQSDTKTPLKTDDDDATSSSLSRYSSVIVATRKFDNPVLFPDSLKLGLWSDSTIQLSSSDATKTSSSSTAFEESSHKNRDNEPSSGSVRYEHEAYSSSLSTTNNGGSSDMNHSSESMNNKSRTSFDAAPHSTSSSLPNSDKSHSSSASDTNNNMLLRMESSYQHFQDMIEEAKTLNEKYLGLNRQGDERSNEGISFDENGSEKEDCMDGESADFKTSSLSDSPNKFREGNLSAITEETDIDNADQLRTTKQRHEDVQQTITDNPDSSTDSAHVTKNIYRSADDFDAYNAHNESSDIVISSPQSPAPLVSVEDESLIILGRDSPYLVQSDPKENEPPNISTRALSIIPEESIISDDQLSEGIIGDDEDDPNMLNTSDSRRDFSKVLGTMVNVDSAVESELISQSFSGGEIDVDMYSAANVVPDSVFSYSQYRPLATHEDDEDPFQGTIYNGTVSNASNENSQFSSVPYALKNDRTEEESQSPKVDSDISGNWAPSESRSMATSKPGDRPRLHTARSTSPIETSDSSHQACEADVSGLSRLSLSQDDSLTEATGLSLQEAFKKNRASFIENSESRIRAGKEARFSKPAAVFERPFKRSGKNHPEVSSKENDGSISQASSVTEQDVENVLGAKSSLDTKRKIDKQDMMARTKRLYQNLPDVRQKQVEKQREGMCTANRAKAQAFHKETRERLRKLSEKKTWKKK